MTGRGQRLAEATTKGFAGICKLLGLAAAFDQLILNSAHPSGVALAFSGCLIAGAQTFEGLFLHAIDTLFDQGSPKGRDEPSQDTSRRRRQEGS